MATIKENIEHLNALILEGKAMEGFELYYDENVVMQENDQEPCIGKDANRQRELEFSATSQSSAALQSNTWPWATT